MGADSRPELRDEASEGIVYCARHPQVETGLRCGRCGTPICPRCLVQTPVGARCRECANLRRLPTVDVTPEFLARGAGAAVVAGSAVGIAWGYLLGGTQTAFLGLFGLFFLALGIGWALGEAVGLATNRKRAVVLQWCAAGGVILAYFVHNLAAGDALLPTGHPLDAWGYIVTAVAAWFAASRVSS